MYTFLLFSFLSFIMIPEPIAAAVGGVVRMRRAKIWTKPENGVFYAHGDLIQEFIWYELSSDMVSLRHQTQRPQTNNLS